MTSTVAQLAYGAAAVLGTAGLAVAHAELRDPEADPFKRLNLMLAQIIASAALVLAAVSAVYLFGLIAPALAAALLYAGYRLARSRNLRLFYPLNYAFGIAACLFAIFALLNATNSVVVTQ